MTFFVLFPREKKGITIHQIDELIRPIQPWRPCVAHQVAHTFPPFQPTPFRA